MNVCFFLCSIFGFLTYLFNKIKQYLSPPPLSLSFSLSVSMSLSLSLHEDNT